jgi:hypothetical protein
MSSKKYYLNEEREITLTVKLKVESISNYHHLTESQIKMAVDELFEQLPSDIVYTFNTRMNNSSENLLSCDRIFFDDLKIVDEK